MLRKSKYKSFKLKDKMLYKILIFFLSNVKGFITNLYLWAFIIKVSHVRPDAYEKKSKKN
jgi:hypothetical protein